MENKLNSYQEKDLKYIWHPCSQMKDYETLPPIVIEKGKGAYLYDLDGNSYLDCISSWWTNTLGHSNDRLNKAITKQINNLEHAIFANFTNIPAIELSEKLVNLTPEGLNKVFFADNGSSAIEIALKMSFQYYQQKGFSKKTKFATVTEGYHGETLAALSVGDLDLYSQIYKPLLLNTLKAESPDCYRCKFNKNRESCSAPCFSSVEKLIEENHEEICAFIIEPLVQAAAGMKIYPPIYLKKLRELCTKYNIHLILDEIAVGFGRTGEMFACNHANISPDIICLSKAITAGYMPLSTVLTTDEIYNCFYSDYAEMKGFFHSHTYCGNAMASAVALENLKILEEENILLKNKEKAQYLKEKVNETFKDDLWVGEIRQIGLITAIELVENKETKKGFSWEKRVGYEIYKIALKKGLLLRPLGNVIYFNPPYIIEKEDIDFMVKIAKESLDLYRKSN
ncbi:MAG: adenosylmethionine--8-amino-7-oxononanoate transaminase [Sarcina sp.]